MLQIKDERFLGSITSVIGRRQQDGPMNIVQSRAPRGRTSRLQSLPSPSRGIKERHGINVLVGTDKDAITKKREAVSTMVLVPTGTILPT